VPDIVLRVGGYAPRDSTHSGALAVFADRVRAASGGRIDVEALWNILDAGRPASDLLDLVEEGELTMCYFSTSYLGARVPLLNVLETPFLFADLEQAHLALDGALGAALSAETEAATGFMVLGYWDNGFRHLTNRLRPIHSPEDCRGMRVRLQPNPIHEAMVEAWGAIPVPVELSRGIEMIAAGAVDAQENPLANTVAYGVDRVHHFATMTGHLYGARGLYAHPATIRGLSEEDQSIVRQAIREAITYQRQKAAAKEEALRIDLGAAGMQFVEPDATERAAFLSATRQVVDEVHRDLGKELFDLATEV